MTLQVKRVVLRGVSSSSRRGAHFRVLDTETGRRSYYKATKARAPTKEAAKAKYAVAEQARRKRLEKTPKKNLAPDEKAEVADLEDATLHFRLDYTGDARSGHKFQMRDSHITAKVPRGMPDDEVREYLRGLFREAFSDQFGGSLSGMVEDDEMVEGLERGQGNSEGIRIRYNYGGKGWKTADAKVGIVKDIITEKERFFYGTLKRSRK